MPHKALPAGPELTAPGARHEDRAASCCCPLSTRLAPGRKGAAAPLAAVLSRRGADPLPPPAAQAHHPPKAEQQRPRPPGRPPPLPQKRRRPPRSGRPCRLVACWGGSASTRGACALGGTRCPPWTPSTTGAWCEGARGGGRESTPAHSRVNALTSLARPDAELPPPHAPAQGVCLFAVSPPDMVEAVTRGVRVSVSTIYAPEVSPPGQHTFSYS